MLACRIRQRRADLGLAGWCGGEIVRIRVEVLFSV